MAATTQNDFISSVSSDSKTSSEKAGRREEQKKRPHRSAASSVGWKCQAGPEGERGAGLAGTEFRSANALVSFLQNRAHTLTNYYLQLQWRFGRRPPSLSSPSKSRKPLLDQPSVNFVITPSAARRRLNRKPPAHPVRTSSCQRIFECSYRRKARTKSAQATLPKA